MALTSSSRTAGSRGLRTILRPSLPLSLTCMSWSSQCLDKENLCVPIIRYTAQEASSTTNITYHLRSHACAGKSLLATAATGCSRLCWCLEADRAAPAAAAPAVSIVVVADIATITTQLTAAAAHERWGLVLLLLMLLVPKLQQQRRRFLLTLDFMMGREGTAPCMLACLSARMRDVYVVSLLAVSPYNVHSRSWVCCQLPRQQQQATQV